MMRLLRGMVRVRTARVLTRGRRSHLLVLLGRGRGRAQVDLRLRLRVRSVLGGSTRLASGDVERGRNRGVGRVGRLAATGVGRISCGAAGRRISSSTLVPGDRTTTMGVGVVGVVVIAIVFLGRTTSRRPTDGETTGHVGAWGRTRHAHLIGPAHGLANGQCRRQRAMRCIETCLDKVLTLGLGDEGLELGSCKGVYEASF
jgi:hypothetical protein